MIRREGDDYAGRVYVSFRLPPSAIGPGLRAQLALARSGDQDAGRWVWERVDVRSDVTRLFGAGAEPVQLAITADTDNTQAATRSGFADFHFVPADIPCDRQQR